MRIFYEILYLPANTNWLLIIYRVHMKIHIWQVKYIFAPKPRSARQVSKHINLVINLFLLYLIKYVHGADGW